MVSTVSNRRQDVGALPNTIFMECAMYMSETRAAKPVRFLLDEHGATMMEVALIGLMLLVIGALALLALRPFA